MHAFSGSDGEAILEGFRRLGMGKVIGVRTWGGEIWLSFDNFLVDNGIASAVEYGVYGKEQAISDVPGGSFKIVSYRAIC